MSLSKLQKEILTFCTIDYAAFSQIVRIVAGEHYFDEAHPDWVRPKTITAIRELVEQSLIEAGELHAPNAEEFVEIGLSSREVVPYIESEWDKLDGNPEIGDICWFKATGAGKKVANTF